MNASRIWMIGLLVAFAPALAQAGPIAVDVQAQITPAPGQTIVLPNAYQLSPNGTYWFNTTPGSWSAPQILATFAGQPSWIDANLGQPNMTSYHTLNYEFTYDLSIRDILSGNTATHSIHGTAFASWTRRDDGMLFPDRLGVELDPTDAKVVVLGGTRYRIGVDLQTNSTLSKAANTASQIGGNVTLEAIPAVPEPATLMLLGSGLLPALCLFRRRRA